MREKKSRVNCQFCNKHYKFSVDELGEMLKKGDKRVTEDPPRADLCKNMDLCRIAHRKMERSGR